MEKKYKELMIAAVILVAVVILIFVSFFLSVNSSEKSFSFETINKTERR